MGIPEGGPVGSDELIRDRPATRFVAMKARIKPKISRLYHGLLSSSLTAVAFMALSIIFSIGLT